MVHEDTIRRVWRARERALPIPWAPPIRVFGPNSRYAALTAAGCIRVMRTIVSALEGTGLEYAAWEARKLTRLLCLVRDVDGAALQKEMDVAFEANVVRLHDEGYYDDEDLSAIVSAGMARSSL